MSDFEVGDIVQYYRTPIAPSDNYLIGTVWVVTHLLPEESPGTVGIAPVFGDVRGETHRKTSKRFVRRLGHAPQIQEG